MFWCFRAREAALQQRHRLPEEGRLAVTEPLPASTRVRRREGRRQQQQLCSRNGSSCNSCRKWG